MNVFQILKKYYCIFSLGDFIFAINKKNGKHVLAIVWYNDHKCYIYYVEVGGGGCYVHLN